MQIHLRQREIEAALSMYVAQQGINLTNKTVQVVFTSGRKDNGLSAELSIEDSMEPNIASPLATVTHAPSVIKEEPAPATEDAPVKASSLFG